MIKKALRLVLLSTSLLSSQSIAGQDGDSNVIGMDIQRCWNTGSLSTQALKASIVVSFETDAEGDLIIESISLVSGSRGTERVYRQAFEAARRAIVRCLASTLLESQMKSRSFELEFDPKLGIITPPTRQPLIDT